MSPRAIAGRIVRGIRRRLSPTTTSDPQEQQLLTLRPPAPLRLHAWVILATEDAELLAPHWEQRRPTPSTWRELLLQGAPDLVVVGAGSSPWTEAELNQLVGELEGRDVPLVAWGDVPELDDREGIVRLARGADVALAVDAWPAAMSLPRPATLRRRSVLLRDREPWRGLLPSRQSGASAAVSATAGEDLAVMSRRRALLVEPDMDARAILRAALVGVPALARRETLSTLPADVARLAHEVSDASVRAELVALVMQDEYLDREAHVLRRQILRGHTGRSQAEAFARSAGRSVPDASVSAVIPTNRTHELDNVLANVGRQRHDQVELVLVAHGLDLNEPDLRARARDAGVNNLVVVHAESALTLGACMNLGVDAASGHYIAKMDDDNIYGAEFLSDLVDSSVQTGAGIVGKWAHYVWLRSTGAVVLRYADAEHTFERRVQGGAMLFDGDLARAVRFSDIPRAVDSDILDRSSAAGAAIYSADRYNFVSVRGSSAADHTWKVEDVTFMTAAGRLKFFGDPMEHVSV